MGTIRVESPSQEFFENYYSSLFKVYERLIVSNCRTTQGLSTHIKIIILILSLKSQKAVRSLGPNKKKFLTYFLFRIRIEN